MFCKFNLGGLSSNQLLITWGSLGKKLTLILPSGASLGMSELTLSHIKLKNGQTYFKNLAVSLPPENIKTKGQHYE